MVALSGCLHSMKHTPVMVPCRSPAVSRAAAVTVHANKLIKGANRPASSKKSTGPSKGHTVELNLQKLACDSSYIPTRQVGPVEVAGKGGAGRGVVAKEDLRAGSLLFVSEPIGPVLTGPLGKQLQPADLEAHWQSNSRQLTQADRYKLSLFFCPDLPAAPPVITFKSFSDDKASSKAKKAAASSKGFGAAATNKGSNQPVVPLELTDEQLAAVLRCNAYGDDHLDGGLTMCRDDEQQSIIGVWPEFALLNHSCAPNTVPPVLVKNRLLLRAASPVPAGEQLTASYLGLAGGIPLQQRRQLLQQHYGFSCNCHRCKAEAAAADEVQVSLQAMFEWSSSINMGQVLQQMAQGDQAAVQQVHDKAAHHVQQFEQQLQQVADAVAVSWLKASAFDTYALLIRTADWLTAQRGTQAASQLADLVRVFAPASESHVLLLSDSAVRAAEAETAGQQLAPEDSRKVRVQRFVQALTLRYGEVRQLEVLTQLAGAATSALGPHWLGLIDMDGQLGLDKLMKGAASAAGGPGGDDSRRKVELSLGQLETLAQSAG